MFQLLRKSVTACIGLLVCSVAGGADVPLVSLGNCIAQLGEAEVRAVEICQAKRARAAIKPGSGRCVSSSRVDSGQLRCDKSDAASANASVGATFSPYYATLGAPISIGSISSFYGGKRAGDNDRFTIAKGNDEQLEIQDAEGFEGSAENCALPENSLRCEIDKGFVGEYHRSTRTRYVYTLRLDGLMAERHIQTRSCVRYECSPGGCSTRCQRYDVSPFIKTSSQLHLWN